MGSIIDGKQLSSNIRQEVKDSVAMLSQKFGRTPSLCVILVGDNSASQVYVRNKKKACEEVGIRSVGYELPESTTEEELLTLIDKLNKDTEIDGILVQLPLPKHIDSQKVLVSIDPNKDVDGFHPVNVGRLVTGVKGFVPCTPAGIIELIKFAGVDISGKNAVVCGRSNIVGKPVAILLTKENATVTITHTKTVNTDEILRNADIVVAAIGVAKHFKKESFKKGACVIDVGMNRDEDGKLCGDVDFDDVYDTVGPITPVPGGVGPMTITMLLKNTVEAFIMHN